MQCVNLPCDRGATWGQKETSNCVAPFRAGFLACCPPMYHSSDGLSLSTTSTCGWNLSSSWGRRGSFTPLLAASSPASCQQCCYQSAGKREPCLRQKLVLQPKSAWAVEAELCKISFMYTWTTSQVPPVEKCIFRGQQD